MAYCIENDKIRVDFDEASGSITGILNKSTEWQLINQPALAAGVELLVPIEDIRNNRTFSNLQKLDCFEKRRDDLHARSSGKMLLAIIQTFWI